MAAIDKIYGNFAQQKDFHEWAKKNRPEILIFFYNWDKEWRTDGRNHPISLFPEWVDRWLLENCPIAWVVDRIKEQYGMETLS